MDGQSISPAYASRLLKLNLENPVPQRPLNASRLEFLKNEYPEGWADKTYRGKSPVLLKELSPQQVAKDKAAGQAYQALLDDLLKESPYVYRYTTKARLEKLLQNGWDLREAFMSNILTEQPNSASLGAQLKPGWYGESGGNPDVVLRIPTSLLSSAKVPRPTGNTPNVAGWEFTTAAYPEAGKGGLLQFAGSLSNQWFVQF